MDTNTAQPANVDTAALSVTYLHLFLELVQEQGWPLSKALADTGIEPEQLHNTDYVSFEQSAQLLLNCTPVMETPALGLRLGQKLRLASHGDLAYLILGADTLLDGIQQFEQFLSTRTQLIQYRVDVCEEDNEVVVSFEVLNGALPESLERFFIESALSGSYGVVREFLHNPNACHRLEFAFAEPSDLSPYLKRFDHPVIFNAAKHSLVLNLQLASEAVPTANQAMLQLAQQQCHQQLEQITGQHTLADTIRQHLYEQANLPQQQLSKPYRFADQADMAKQLNISGRSLRRQLQEANTSYQEILADVRSSLAKHYLLESDFAIEQIALMLGYSDTANFSRAFRRWTGVAPGKYREGQTT